MEVEIRSVHRWPSKVPARAGKMDLIAVYRVDGGSFTSLSLPEEEAPTREALLARIRARHQEDERKFLGTHTVP